MSSCQVFPQLEQLQQHYCAKVQQETYSSLFRNNPIKNSLPDPEVPRGCDINSQE